MITKICPGCGKEYLARQNSRKFCSKQCKYDSERGEKNKNFIGGEYETRKCKNCGKDFQARRRSLEGWGVFCSLSCRNTGEFNPVYVGKVKVNCKVCGKEFEALPSELERGRKFCSPECTYSENGRKLRNVEQVKCVCKVCSKEFTTQPAWIRKGNTGKYCSKECVFKDYKNIHNRKQTKIEKKMQDELTQRGIHFLPEESLEGITIADFLLPNRVVIYCDGDYWHTINGAEEKDARITKTLEEKGYKVFRFWEHDIIKDVKKCVDEIAHTYI